MRLRQRAFIVAIVVSLFPCPRIAWSQVSSQNPPAPGDYLPVPNFVGLNAGAGFRGAINDRLSGVQPISPRIVNLPLASLPAEQDGRLIYCADCQKTIPCAGGGTGAWAFGQNGQWSCTAPNVPASALYSGQSGATLNSLAGSGTAPSISKMSVNGVVNVQAFGASGAGMHVTTGTIGAGSSSLAVGSASGWSAGAGIIVSHAGAAETMTTPGAPAVVTVGTAGSTTYTYECVAIDSRNGYTAAGPSASTTTGPATLTYSNFNRIACPTVSGAAFLAVYQTAPGSYLVGLSSGTRVVDIGNGYNSTGGPNLALFNNLFGDLPATAPSSAAADWLQTTITAINGNTFTLAANATTAATSANISHDDTAALAAAAQAAQAADAKVYVPSGSYFYCGTPLNEGSLNWFGSKLNSSIINLCAGQVLFQPNQYLFGADIENLTFNGGKSVFNNIWTGAVTQGYVTHTLASDVLWNYTGTAFADVLGDHPFWKIDHNSFSALDDHASIGVAINPSTGNQIVNNNFGNGRIGLKVLYGGTGDYAAANSYLRNIPQPNPLEPRIGLWIVPAVQTYNGAGFIQTGSKFGNENYANDDVHVLVADDNTSSGTDESNYLPLYYTADDLSMTAGGTTVTSAAECPFTSAMCQGGTGCTGSTSNWPIVVEGAGTVPGGGSFAEHWSGLTTTITGFTNSCSVTVAAAATNAVTGQVGRFAPADTTNYAANLQFIGNFAFDLGYAGSAFMVSTVQEGAANELFSGNYMSVNTAMELLLPLINGAYGAYYSQENVFVGGHFMVYQTNQDEWMTGASYSSVSASFGRGNNVDALVTNPTLPLIGAWYGGLAIEGNTANASSVLGVFNSNKTQVFEVDGYGNGDFNGAVTAFSFHSGCSGQATLASGTVSVSNSCIVTGRPTFCTDNTSTSGAGCSAVISAGSITIYGSGSDVVSWQQF